MFIDLFAVTIVLVFAYFGWKSGLVRQVVHWAALAGAAALAPPLGLALCPYLEHSLARFPYWATPTTGLLLAWLLLFVVFDSAGVVIHRLIASTKNGNALHIADHIGGVAFGGLKGLVIAFFLSTGIFLLRAPLADAYPGLKPALSHSYAVKAVSSFDPLAKLVRSWRKEHVRAHELARAVQGAVRERTSATQ